MRDPLDLLIYVPSLSGGGAERAVIDVATGMGQRGYSCTLCCNQVGEAYRPLLDERELPVLELCVKRTVAALPGLARTVRSRRPRTVLSTITHANVVAALAARAAFPAPRIVLRQANTMPASEQRNLRAKLSVRSVPWVYRTADAIVAVSQATSDDMARHGVPAEKISVIENGVDHAFIEREALKLPEKPPPSMSDSSRILVSLGRLTKQKAFDTLLHAHARLDDDVQLWILGEGSDRRALEALAHELGVEERVWLPGFVSNPFPYIKRANAFVLSSRWEGMPNALVQALSLGVPCVATDAPGGSREVLMDGKVGWLAPVDDPSSLADAIHHALRTPAVRRPDSAWRERFSSERMMDRYERTLFPSGIGRSTEGMRSDS